MAEIILTGACLQYPLSKDEHAAMVRYLMGIRKQLQDVSDLFCDRYGKNSNVAEMAVKALVSTALLEHELTLLDVASDGLNKADEMENLQTRSVAY